LVDKVHTTPANRAESPAFGPMIEEAKGRRGADPCDPPGSAPARSSASSGWTGPMPDRQSRPSGRT
ncbi:MAG: hypothetical protein OXC93_07415, partial [Rhodospirillaceae bacterium]|nr:hypothetical protein [Rhodospirillaceae bacterium]